MHWPDPAQRHRIAEIRDNLTARIAEAEREGWLGEIVFGPSGTKTCPGGRLPLAADCAACGSRLDPRA
jgi:hypothetical protein